MGDQSVKYLALLRGINVGGKNILPKNQLKQVFKDLGYSNVLTYIQSGNILFRSKETDRWDQFTFEHIKPANEINVIDYDSISSIQCERNIESSTYIDYLGQQFPCCHTLPEKS